VPHEIRSDRSDENPIPLIEQKERGVTFPVNLSTEVVGNFSGGKTRAAIWESLLIAGVAIDFEKAAGIPGLSLVVSGLYGFGPSLTSKAVHDLNLLSNIDPMTACGSTKPGCRRICGTGSSPFGPDKCWPTQSFWFRTTARYS
jgi:hypothetical protein